MSTPQGQMLAIQQRSDKDAMTQRAVREADALFTTGASFDPDQVTQNFMAPIMNLNGQATGWRYLMQNKPKMVCSSGTTAEHLLGRMAARAMDKVSAKEQNQQVSKALFEHFKSAICIPTHNFVFVGPDQPGPGYTRPLE